MLKRRSLEVTADGKPGINVSEQEMTVSKCLVDELCFFCLHPHYTLLLFTLSTLRLTEWSDWGGCTGVESPQRLRRATQFFLFLFSHLFYFSLNYASRLTIPNREISRISHPEEKSSVGKVACLQFSIGTIFCWYHQTPHFPIVLWTHLTFSCWVFRRGSFHYFS